MTTKACPVCGFEQDKEISECGQCGWDFSPLLGTAEKAEVLLSERLGQARTAWRQGRAATDHVTALPRDAFETHEEHDAPLRSQSRLRAVQFPAMSSTDQTQRRRLLGALLVGLGLMVSLVFFLLPQSDQPEPELFAGRYRNLGDGTVMDVQTGLQWMRCSLGQAWDGLWFKSTCAQDPQQFTFQYALSATTALNEQGGYAGYQDWRIPSIEELKGLVYCETGGFAIWKATDDACEGNYSKPTIDGNAFPKTPPNVFLSSSPYADDSGFAWYVDFGYGFVANGYKSLTSYVRLVRGGQ